MAKIEKDMNSMFFIYKERPWAEVAFSGIVNILKESKVKYKITEWETPMRCYVIITGGAMKCTINAIIRDAVNKIKGKLNG